MTKDKAIDPDEQLREWAESVGIWSNHTGKPTKLASIINPDLESCRVCMHRVSRLAKICPKCGCSDPYISHSGNAVVAGVLIPVLLLFVMGVLVSIESKPTDYSWTQATASHSEAELSSELDKIEAEAVRQSVNGKVNTAVLNERLNDVRKAIRKKNQQFDRKQWESGYTLEERKQVAVMILIRQGYSLSEAIQIVDKAERSGLLPDPPRR